MKSDEKFPTGKQSSIFVLEIIRTSMFPLIRSKSNFSFLVEVKFKWAKTKLFEFSVEIFLLSILFLFLRERFDLHSSLIEAKILPTQCQLKTVDISFKIKSYDFGHFLVQVEFTYLSELV